MILLYPIIFTNVIRTTSEITKILKVLKIDGIRLSAHYPTFHRLNRLFKPTSIKLSRIDKKSPVLRLNVIYNKYRRRELWKSTAEACTKRQLVEDEKRKKSKFLLDGDRISFFTSTRILFASVSGSSTVVLIL